MSTDLIESLSTDRYTPVARIGSGGQAEILLAVQRGSGGFEKLVVIKRLLPHLAGDEGSRRRLTQEAQLVARLHHPNVCQVLNLIENDSGPLLVLEYLDGITVAQVAADLPAVRSPDEIRLIAGALQQASEGLHSAHTLRDRTGAPARLVHRDVSSANLIITREGIVKVLDFGIAKASSSDDSKVQSIRGTVPFMSPEQVKGEELDQRSDVFSLAVVAYEALTGLALHRRADLHSTWAAILTLEPPEIGDNQPALPAALERVLRKALEKEREDRHASAREFGSAVAESVRELGGPMNFSEIAEVVETRFAQVLIERSRQFESMRMEQRTATVVEPAERWTQETFFGLPQVDLSVQFQSTLGLDTPAGQPAGRTASPVTVPERPPRPRVEPEPPSAPSLTRLGVGAPPLGPAPGAGMVPVGGTGMAPAGGAGMAPAGGAGMAPAGGAGMVPAESTPARMRGSSWLLIALVALVGSGLVTYALVRANRSGVAGESVAAAPPGVAPGQHPAVAPASPAAPSSPAAEVSPPPTDVPAPSPATEVPEATLAAVAHDAGPPVADAGRTAPADTADAVPQAEPGPPARAASKRSTKGTTRRTVRPARARPAAEAPGYFTIDSRPAARISIDGRAMGQVPLYRVELSPGRHEVVATLEDGRTRSYTVVIKSGEDLRKRLRW